MTIEQSLGAGMQCHRAGDLAGAERHYREVLAARPEHPDALQLLGLLAHHAGQHAAGEELISHAIALSPPQAEYFFNLGLVLSAQGKWERAIAAYRQAVAIRPNWPEAHNNLGSVLHDRGQPSEALACFEQALFLAGAGGPAPRPQCADFYFNAGNSLVKLNRLDDAIGAFAHVVAIRPDFAAAYNNLGHALMHRHRPAEAEQAFSKAIAIVPEFAEARNNLGNALLALGRTEEAEAAFREATRIRTDYAGAHNNLANALRRRRKLPDAIAAYSRALELRPEWPEVQTNLAAAQQAHGDFDEAIENYQAARRLLPEYWDASNGLGSTLRAVARLDEAIECYARAESLEPRLVDAASGRLFTIQFHPAYDAQRLLAEHQRFDRVHAEPLKRFIKPHENDRSPQRRLRIGYVSPDFRDHCQSLFTGGLLAAHDREQVEVYCYSSVVDVDATTARLRALADTWRDVTGKSDESLAEEIHADRIDVQMNLTMHMSAGRPLLFARKPAPVQFAWLAYPGTTGISAMDYRLTDPQLDPPGTCDERYTERSIRLPDTFWCYDPRGLETDANSVLPEPGPLPMARNGYVTFGCLNDFCKMTSATLALWSFVLRANPRSRLRLLAPAGKARQWVLAELERNSVESNRVDFVARQSRTKYLAEFREIDVCLDTTHYNGHTTSLDSYWMGVPVVSLVGKTVVGRAGLSQLSNLKMPELAAADDEQFVRIATELAGDSVRLTEMRQSLRDRVMNSPLTDATRFARNVENAYREAWLNWIAAK